MRIDVGIVVTRVTSRLVLCGHTLWAAVVGVYSRCPVMYGNGVRIGMIKMLTEGIKVEIFNLLRVVKVMLFVAVLGTMTRRSTSDVHAGVAPIQNIGTTTTVFAAQGLFDPITF
jgi:hypothetical protein